MPQAHNNNMCIYPLIQTLMNKTVDPRDIASISAKRVSFFIITIINNICVSLKRSLLHLISVRASFVLCCLGLAIY
jgi:hypothetical protein